MDLATKLQAQALMRSELLPEQREFLAEYISERTFDRALKKCKVSMVDFMVWQSENQYFKKEFDNIRQMKAMKIVYDTQDMFANAIELFNEEIAKKLSITPERLEKYYNDELSLAEKAEIESAMDTLDLTKVVTSANNTAMSFKRFIEQQNTRTETVSAVTIDSFLNE